MSTSPIAENRESDEPVYLTTEDEIRTCLQDGHDVGMRHEDGSLYSATCHDCGTWWYR